MAATNGGAFSASRTAAIVIDLNGNMHITLQYTNTANGHAVTMRSLLLPLTGPVVDDFGTTINATTPVAVASALANLLAAVDATIVAGAGAGKLDL